MENIKNLRKKLGKSQQEVAIALGITNQTYSNYENDQRKPDPNMLIAMADYYGVTVDNILDRPNYYPHDLKLAPDEYLTIGCDGKKEILRITPELKAYINFIDNKTKNNS